MTHGDQFRAMSDEQLAALFSNGECGYCKIYDFCHSLWEAGGAPSCFESWLAYLKKEEQP